MADLRSGSLADSLQASVWVIAFRDVDRAQASAAVEDLLARDEASVTRTFKNGPRTFDVRSAVVALHVLDDAGVAAVPAHALAEPLPGSSAGCAILRLVVRHTTPAVRPDDILAAVRSVAGLVPPTSPLVTRLAQGPLTEASAEVADPLAADLDVDGSPHGGAHAASREGL